MTNRPVHDQHGNPVPGVGGGSESLGPDQVDGALPWLPGWTRRGASLVRQVSVEPGDREILREGLRNVVGNRCSLAMDETEDGLTILVGADVGDITAADLEVAAQIDSVLSGSVQA